jgi:Asp-tRNA(Asn)/Glu-tRNA(Gln) amidotransferase A subunit family amidase
LDTAGIRTTWGAEPFRNRVPKQDATVVARLKAAGGILVAKLSLGALALNDVWYGGRTNNPWLLEEGSGGSSAGSGSSVGAGLVPFAIGSETYGSIVDPSDKCGVTGLRPTFGRVPRGGAMTLSWSHDKLGPMARPVEDTALVLAPSSDSGPDRPSPAADRLDATRGEGAEAAWSGHDERGAGERGGPGRAGDVRKAGMEVVELTFPPFPWACLQSLVLADAAASFEALTLSGAESQLRMQVRDAWPNLFRQSRFLSAVDYVQADRFRRKATQLYADQMAKVDVLLAPSLRDEALATNSRGPSPPRWRRAGFVEIDPDPEAAPLPANSTRRSIHRERSRTASRSSGTPGTRGRSARWDWRWSAPRAWPTPGRRDLDKPRNAEPRGGSGQWHDQKASLGVERAQPTVLASSHSNTGGRAASRWITARRRRGRRARASTAPAVQA